AKIIKAWNDKFSPEYKRLQLGFEYLKNCKKVDFVSFSHQNSAHRAHVQKQNEKQQIFVNQKYKEYIKEMINLEPDIKNCIKQLEQSIKILIPSEDFFSNEDFIPAESKMTPTKQFSNEDEEESDDSDEELVEVPIKRTKEDIIADTNLEIHYLGFLDKESTCVEDLKNTQVKIEQYLKETDDNKIVIDIMKDLSKEIKNSHLYRINKWIKNFTQVREASEYLKQAIDLKNEAKNILKKFDDLNIKSEQQSQNPKDNFFEDISNNSLPGTSKMLAEQEEKKNFDEKDAKRSEMLKLAPVIDLDEMVYLNPVVQKVETQNPLFQRRENEVTHDLIENAHRLTKMSFVGNFEPVKWSCRAPLKNGKLCPRMDRHKCPLHGKIVARDQMGNIFNEKDKIEFEKNKVEVKPWQDAGLLADINAATGLNLTVDNKKAKKRKSGNITDLKKTASSSTERLKKKLLDSKSLRKIGSILDAIETRRNYEKFHHNYNYAIQS
ncbi:UV-stimulated scaffold A-like, partial [Brachionus plicatilis]